MHLHVKACGVFILLEISFSNIGQKTFATNGHKLSIMTFAVHLKHMAFEKSISTFNTLFLICMSGIPKIQKYNNLNGTSSILIFKHDL